MACKSPEDSSVVGQWTSSAVHHPIQLVYAAWIVTSSCFKVVWRPTFDRSGFILSADRSRNICKWHPESGEKLQVGRGMLICCRWFSTRWVSLIKCGFRYDNMIGWGLLFLPNKCSLTFPKLISLKHWIWDFANNSIAISCNGNIFVFPKSVNYRDQSLCSRSLVFEGWTNKLGYDSYRRFL